MAAAVERTLVRSYRDWAIDGVGGRVMAEAVGLGAARPNARAGGGQALHGILGDRKNMIGRSRGDKSLHLQQCVLITR